LNPSTLPIAANRGETNVDIIWNGTDIWPRVFFPKSCQIFINKNTLSRTVLSIKESRAKSFNRFLHVVNDLQKAGEFKSKSDLSLSETLRTYDAKQWLSFKLVI
jgi:hypothetical protein